VNRDPVLLMIVGPVTASRNAVAIGGLRGP